MCPTAAKAAGTRSPPPCRRIVQAAARGGMPVAMHPTIAKNGTNHLATEMAGKGVLTTDRNTRLPSPGHRSCTHRRSSTASPPSRNHPRITREGAREASEETEACSGRMSGGDRSERAAEVRSLTLGLRPRPKSARARTGMAGVVMEMARSRTARTKEGSSLTAAVQTSAKVEVKKVVVTGRGEAAGRNTLTEDCLPGTGPEAMERVGTLRLIALTAVRLGGETQAETLMDGSVQGMPQGTGERTAKPETERVGCH